MVCSESLSQFDIDICIEAARKRVERLGLVGFVGCAGLHHGANAVVGKQLEQKRMRHGAVDDVCGGNARIERRKARFDLGDHATGKRARFDELAGFFRCERGDKGVFVAEVFIEAVDIGKEDDLVRVQRRRQMPRRDIGVDVERLAVVARRDGRYDGDVIVIDEVLEVGGVDARDFATSPWA